VSALNYAQVKSLPNGPPGQVLSTEYQVLNEAARQNLSENRVHAEVKQTETLPNSPVWLFYFGGREWWLNFRIRRINHHSEVLKGPESSVDVIDR
jgi:hypothetical protein